MKASDSTNSLTELTGRDECFVCLSVENDSGEPLVHSKLLRTCGCKFFVHPECWNQWQKDKSDYDCPICRRESVLKIKIPHPILLVEIPEEMRRQQNKKILCKVLVGIAIVSFTLGIILSFFLMK